MLRSGPACATFAKKIQGFRHRRANYDLAAWAHGWRGNPTDEMKEFLNVPVDRGAAIHFMERQRRPPCKGALQQPGATPLGQPQATVA
jgi:hypothetical protein